MVLGASGSSSAPVWSRLVTSLTGNVSMSRSVSLETTSYLNHGFATRRYLCTNLG
jgi:hypothetical protein